MIAFKKSTNAAVGFVSKYKSCWAYFLGFQKNVFLLLNISDK
jgi:hypothetical protein